MLEFVVTMRSVYTGSSRLADTNRGLASEDEAGRRRVTLYIPSSTYHPGKYESRVLYRSPIYKHFYMRPLYIELLYRAAIHRALLYRVLFIEPPYVEPLYMEPYIPFITDIILKSVTDGSGGFEG